MQVEIFMEKINKCMNPNQIWKENKSVTWPWPRGEERWILGEKLQSKEGKKVGVHGEEWWEEKLER